MFNVGEHVLGLEMTFVTKIKQKCPKLNSEISTETFLTSEAIHCWFYSFAGLVSCGPLIMKWHPSTTGHMHCLFMILVRVHLSVTHI